MVLYPVLAGEIAKRGIKKKDIAKSIGICDRAMSNKFSGRVPFTMPEAKTIKREYFPDIPLNVLFAEADELNNTPGA